MPLRIDVLTGPTIAPALPALARLRISEFLDWPYLYSGSVEYERKYLADFSAATDAVIVVVSNGDEIVGASTGVPLVHHQNEFATPFMRHGYDIGRFFYFGESVLQPAFRGQGLGHKFFDVREAHARRIGTFTHTTFCSVVRPINHPARPPIARSLEPFWIKRGYRKRDDLVTKFSWLDVGDLETSEKLMQFWIRAL
jgi:hypothetical protein